MPQRPPSQVTSPSSSVSRLRSMALRDLPPAPTEPIRIEIEGIGPVEFDAGTTQQVIDATVKRLVAENQLYQVNPKTGQRYPMSRDALNAQSNAALIGGPIAAQLVTGGAVSGLSAIPSALAQGTVSGGLSAMQGDSPTGVGVNTVLGLLSPAIAKGAEKVVKWLSPIPVKVPPVPEPLPVKNPSGAAVSEKRGFTQIFPGPPSPVVIKGNTFPVWRELKALGGVYDEAAGGWKVAAEHAEEAQSLVDAQGLGSVPRAPMISAEEHAAVRAASPKMGAVASALNAGARMGAPVAGAIGTGARLAPTMSELIQQFVLRRLKPQDDSSDPNIPKVVR